MLTSVPELPILRPTVMSSTPQPTTASLLQTAREHARIAEDNPDSETGREHKRIAEEILQESLDRELADLREIIEGDLPGLKIHLKPATPAMDLVRELLLLRTAELPTEVLSFRDFCLEIAAEAVAEARRRALEANTLFERMYSTDARMIRGFVSSRLRKPVWNHRVQEITDDTFLIAQRIYDPDRGPLTPLLFQIARNSIRKEWRREGNRRDRERPIGKSTPHPAAPALKEGMSPDEGGCVEERLRAISRLDRPEWELLAYLLHHDLDWKPRRILRCIASKPDRHVRWPRRRIRRSRGDRARLCAWLARDAR